MKKRMLSLALVLAMATSLVACGGKGSADTEAPVDPATIDKTHVLNQETYYDESQKIYDAVLGDFYSAYMTAKEATNVSEKYALMAVAEAKLLESGVMLPTRTQGGLYAVSRVASYTVDYSLWGNDYERYHSALVCTNPITSTDRAEIKAQWAEMKAQGGDAWMKWVKDYLTGKGYTLKDKYTITYNEDPATWDVLATSKAVDSEAIINTYDGLAEYDTTGALMPALAESWEVSEDGLTWTFHIRKGVKWVDSQGRAVADVKADDFVAGMQHMMDAAGGLEYLVQGVIVNANEYIGGDDPDFNNVGVKATDDYTLVYSLCAPCSYFDTMLGYGVFAPLCRSYYTSMGGKFGSEYDDSAADYKYGKNPSSIVYCGPYLVTNATEKNTIVFSANPTYWNPSSVNVKTLVWAYNDGKDPTKNYNDFVSGALDGCSLTDTVLEMAKKDSLSGDSETVYDKYSYTSATNATSYMSFLNLNRYAFANVSDENAVVSAMKDDEDAQWRTRTAMQNQNFRLALNMAVDRATYNAQVNGEELKLNSLRNSYTPGTFVSLAEEVTIDINGTATTFAAGTFYGEIMQAQLDADGCPLKAWDPSADDGVGSSDGFDGWYNPAEAVKALEAAVEELKKQGVEITAENPIHIDYPYPEFYEMYANCAQVYKKSVEDVLGGLVIVDLPVCTDQDSWLGTGYLTSYGYEANYDLYDLSGWGPDYGDPSTYLDTMLPQGAGYMAKCIGLF